MTDATLGPLQALAARAVVCPGWRWLPGCRVDHVHDGEVTGSGTYLGTGVQPEDLCIQWDDSAPRGVSSDWSSPQNFRPAPHIGDVAAPKLDDPATLGCLIALVREARGCPGVYVAHDGTYSPEPTCSWFVGLPDTYIDGHTELAREDTEAEALVAALEAAP